MDMPKLPTDNLYKFIAIGGIVLVVASYASLVYKENENANRIFYNASKAATLKQKVDNLQNDLEGLASDSAKSVNGEIIKERALAIKKISEGYQLEAIQVEQEFKLNDYLDQRFKEETRFLKGQIDVGFLFICIGFVCWYYKLQIYLDRIIKDKANSMK